MSIGHQSPRTRVSWPVTVLTPDGQVEGLTVNICSAGTLIASRKSLPLGGVFRVVIKAPNRQPLNITAKALLTTKCGGANGAPRLETLLHFVEISRADRDYLRKAIGKHFEKKRQLAAQKGSCRRKTAGVGEKRLNHVPRILEARMPVSFSKGEKQVKAIGSRFSTRGCYVYSKMAPPAGTAFPLMIMNSGTGKSIKVGSYVIARRHYVARKHWGSVVRFVNLTETDKHDIRRVLKNTSVEPRPQENSEWLKTKSEQSAQTRISVKKPENGPTQLRHISGGNRESLEALLKKTETKWGFQHVLCLWLGVELGLSSSQVARAVGWTPSEVEDMWTRFSNKGRPVLTAADQGKRPTARLQNAREGSAVSGFTGNRQGGRAIGGPLGGIQRGKLP
ncbi:MAG: PilZ domain-containing protein [Deltaproteobacteria bacterium]|nr:MAG: PilZ domain-containing protein [Deltaproteobacteria bacterium]